MNKKKIKIYRFTDLQVNSIHGNYSSSKIIIPNNEIINYKEALIFAFLGLLRIRNEVNCLQEVTGATKDNCGGVIYKPL